MTRTSPRLSQPRWSAADTVAFLERVTLALYARASAHAEARGIILADTKFEFGWTGRPGDSDLMLIDEAVTPDSSRFWPKDGYRPGGAQASYDKQFVRDYLEAIRWNKQPPVPALPDDVVRRTREKYLEAFHAADRAGAAVSAHALRDCWIGS